MTMILIHCQDIVVIVRIVVTEVIVPIGQVQAIIPTRLIILLQRLLEVPLHQAVHQHTFRHPRTLLGLAL